MKCAICKEQAIGTIGEFDFNFGLCKKHGKQYYENFLSYSAICEKLGWHE